MLFRNSSEPVFIADVFGHHYEVVHLSGAPQFATRQRSLTDKESAIQFLRGLRVSVHTWRQLLAVVKGTQPFGSSDSAILRACAMSAVQGRIRFYPVPRLGTGYSSVAEPGWGYAFTPGPREVHHAAGKCVAVANVDEAKAIVERLSPSTSWANILYEAGLEGSIAADAPAANRAQVVLALSEKQILAYRVPHRQRPKAESRSAELLPVPAASTRPVPLAPVTSPAKTNSQAALPKPARTLHEAEDRLLKARPAVLAAKRAGKPLPQSPFSLEDKQAIINDGLEESITVRVIESKYAKDEGWIGRPTEAGHSYSFSAPLSLVEHGDTDPEALLNAFGTRFDPEKSYTILLLDVKKLGEVGDVVPIIPTYANLYALIEQQPQLTSVDQNTVKQVLNDEFAPKYKAFADEVAKSDIDQKSEDRLIEFALDEGFDADEAEALAARHFIAQDISTWEIFTGNGMTLDTNVKDEIAYGPVEVFAFDKKPMRLGYLQSKKAIKRLPASQTQSRIK